ncbi:MAG: hypothetical protein SNJ29_09190 [Rikenellaceae bacterium]
MKKSRYISFALFLLFVISIGCRLSLGLFCSCEEDVHRHEHERVHVCCSCPEHISDCCHHDKTYKDHSCHFHLDGYAFVAEQITNEVKSNNINSLGRVILFLTYSLFGSAGCVTDERVEHFDSYSFAVSEWSSVSCSLRAPPVLV